MDKKNESGMTYRQAADILRAMLANPERMAELGLCQDEERAIRKASIRLDQSVRARRYS